MTFSGPVGVQLPLLCAAVLAVSFTASDAGTCLPEISRAQADIDAKLEAKAAATDPAAKESAAATMHRQPTPHSLAITESQLGLISRDDLKMLESTVGRAREADSSGDKSTCEEALAAARRILNSM